MALTARRAGKLAEGKEKCLAACRNSGSVPDENAVVIIEADVERVARSLEGRTIDILVNNAGMVRGRGYVGGSIYCVAKHAVAAFSNSLVEELVHARIRVCEIQPGMVETEFSIVRYRGEKTRADSEYKGCISKQSVSSDFPIQGDV
ncbi:hypothetical protein BDW59DRAFT_166187 [Aspergillus cavernicola]|uniref:NAD(P)-binding protein n=1 Tax=Aspergillus cavernicola TaxID=176166 RepID=A0ABR4HMY0_9EURO